ncbi:fumarylacetoacetate hydrolase family protein [Bordetella genomosp. 13]|uniref:fumarylacetoacetate hydrolase family protein n=1 Tax=Bordetella genomosp. 13 TaxID=463040 RepID=UPI0011A45ABF|nr:fumarylacetoacetate hydrolase family protein [Bordetella genomosp. 13]
MRIATFKHGAQRLVGVVSDDQRSVRPYRLAPDAAQRGVQSLIERSLQSGAALPQIEDHAIDLADVTLEAPLPLPRRNLWCVGRNYKAHAKELAATVFKDSPRDTAAWPIVFTKAPETVIGPYAPVQLPGPVSAQIDYEAELAIVIGKPGKNIAREDALDHVFGYTIVNDVTARDVQMRHQQWDLGKSFDTFCPMGPWIVTADAFDGARTRIRCWVTPAGKDAELRQDARTEDLIFDIPTLIATCSAGITLQPGDVIATGSPAGVGMGMNPPRYLGVGDSVRIEIDGLGFIENSFV